MQRNFVPPEQPAPAPMPQRGDALAAVDGFCAADDALVIKACLAAAHVMGRLPVPDPFTGDTRKADQAFVQRLVDALAVVNDWAERHAWQVLQPSGLCAHHDLAARFGPDGPIPAPPLAGCPECAPALAAGIALLGRGQGRDLSGAHRAAAEGADRPSAGGRA